MTVGAEAEVPFANESGGVAGGAQVIGDGPLVERQPQARLVAYPRVELGAEPGLVPAGEQPGAGRTAVGCGDVPVGAAHAGLGKGVDVRRRNVATAVHSDVPVSEIIREDHENIRGR